MKKITFTQLKQILQESKKTVKEHFTDEDFEDAEEMASDAIANRKQWEGGDVYGWLEDNYPTADMRVITFATEIINDRLEGGINESDENDDELAQAMTDLKRARKEYKAKQGRGLTGVMLKRAEDKVKELKKARKESVKEGTEQFEGTKFFIESWSAESTEDNWEHGESLHVDSSWDGKDIPVNGNFDTVEQAIEAVCKANYFTFDPEDWVAFKDESILHGDVLVDENNEEARDPDIAAWKKGEKRLWNCHLTVKVMKRTAPQPCSDEDLAGFQEG